MSVMENMGGSL